MIVNLDTLLTGADPGGTWTEGPCSGPNTNPQAITPFNPTMLDFSGVIPGSYTFAYTVTQGSCSDCEEVFVTVLETPQITLPADQEYCAYSNNTPISVTAIITNLSNGLPFTGPYFIDWSIDGGFPLTTTGPTLNGSLVPNICVNIEATVRSDSNPECTGNTDLIVVCTTPLLSAGDDNSTTICPTDPYNLTTLLMNQVIPPGAVTGWTQTGGPATDVSDPTMVDLSVVGNYTFDYTVTLTTAQNVCVDIATMTVTVVDADPGPPISQTYCDPPVTVNLTALVAGVGIPPGGTPSWVQTGGLTVDLTDPSSVDFNQIGTYTFNYIVTTGTCQTVTPVTIVIVNQANSGTPIPTNVCNNSVFNLNDALSGEDPGGTWTFNTGPQVINPSGSTVNFNTATPGTYQYDYNVGTAPCNDSDTVTIQVYENPVLELGPNISDCETCGGGVTVNISPVSILNNSDGAPFSGTLTYQWLINGTPSGTGTSISPTLNSGVFTISLTVTETDSGIACSDVDSLTLTITNVCAGTGNDAKLCLPSGGTVFGNLNSQITGAAGPKSWMQISGPAVDISDPNNVPFTSSGIYVFELTTSILTCSDTEQITIEIFDQPEAVSVPGQVCLNANPFDLSTLTAGSTPGGTYTWTGGPEPVPVVGSNANFTGVQPGVYQFDYSVSNGPCDAQTMINVTVVDIPVPSIGPFPDICLVGPSATTPINLGVTVTSLFSGGPWSGPITYDWEVNGSPVSTNPTYNANLGPGTYVVDIEVCNSLACCNSDTDTFEISPHLYAGVGSPMNVNCTSDLSCVNINTLISGEVVPGGATETWTQISGTPVTVGDGTCIDFTLTGPGTYVFEYEVAITVPFACSDTEQVTVTIAPFTVDAGDPNPLSLNCPLGPSWAVNLLNQVGNPTTGGTWIITDAPSFPAQLIVNGAPIAPYNDNDPVGTGDNPLVNFAGAEPGLYTFDYTVCVGSCGCDTISVDITIPCCADAGSGGTGTACNDNANYDLNNLITGGSPGGTWSVITVPVGSTIANPISNVINFTGEPPGTYVFRYTHVVGGCTDTTDVTVNLVDDPVVTITTPGPIRHCNNTGSISIAWNRVNNSDGSPQTALATIQLFRGATLVTQLLNSSLSSGTFTPVPPNNGTSDSVTHIYSVVVTLDGSGCTDTDTITVVTSPAISSGSGASIGIICQPETCYDFTQHLSGNIVPNNAIVTWAGIGAASGLDMSDPTCVDITSLSPGPNYQVQYQVCWSNWPSLPGGPPVCCSPPATFTFQTQNAGNAGTAVPMPEACNDEVVDLFDLITGENPGGTWTYNAGPTSPLDGLLQGQTVPGGSIDFTGANGGVYQFTYEQGTAPCADNELVTLTVGDVPVASMADQNLCNTSGSVNINLVVNPQSSGAFGGPYVGPVNYAWTENGSPVGGNLPSLTVSRPAGTYVYVVTMTGLDAGVPCDGTATATVNVAPRMTTGSPDPGTVDCGITSIVNLFDFVFGEVLPAGTTYSWIDLDGSGADITDPLNADFSGVADGTYTFVLDADYNVPPFTCNQQTFVEITVVNCESPCTGLQTCDYTWNLSIGELHQLTDIVLVGGGSVPLPNYPYEWHDCSTALTTCTDATQLQADLQAYVDASGCGGTVTVTCFSARVTQIRITGTTIEFAGLSGTKAPPGPCTPFIYPDTDFLFVQSNCV